MNSACCLHPAFVIQELIFFINLLLGAIDLIICLALLCQIYIYMKNKPWMRKKK